MKLPNYLVTILATILFVLLFFEKSLGLNVAIYGVSTIILLVTFKTAFFKPSINKIVGVGFLLTTIFYYLYASPFTLGMAIVSFAMIIGLHSTIPFRSYLYALPNFVPNYFSAIGAFFTSFSSRKKRMRSLGISKLFRIIFLPMFIVLLFVALYSMGSSYFSEAIAEVASTLSQAMSRITQYIDIAAVFVAFVGLLFGVIHSLGYQTTVFSTKDTASTDILSRVRDTFRKRFRNLDLGIEYKSGIFLFSVLSILLSLLLVLEIKHVWIGFQWEGEMLKDLVHKGTYVLIIAILISMGVTMYYFRKNLNFYKNNTWLKGLAYGWIGLNILLVVSVFVRNYYYIQHFGLAHKRIGVIVFLILCIIGLVTLAIKINRRRTAYYVTRINASATYMALVAVCLINWDAVIAKHNLSHYQTAFVHLPYLSELSDKALPYLELSDEQILEIENKQVEEIPFVKRGYFVDEDYKNKIDTRVQAFKAEYKERHWLEQVWSESRAYDMLE